MHPAPPNSTPKTRRPIQKHVTHPKTRSPNSVHPTPPNSTPKTRRPIQKHVAQSKNT